MSLFTSGFPRVSTFPVFMILDIDLKVYISHRDKILSISEYPLKYFRPCNLCVCKSVSGNHGFYIFECVQVNSEIQTKQSGEWKKAAAGVCTESSAGKHNKHDMFSKHNSAKTCYKVSASE